MVFAAGVARDLKRADASVMQDFYQSDGSTLFGANRISNRGVSWCLSDSDDCITLSK